MKKIYILPTTNVVNIELTPLLSASGNTTPNYDPNTSYSDEEKVGSRKKRDLWDEEEEEEY